MEQKMMDEITKLLKSVEGRTDDPNSKNPLTKEEISMLAKFRISGIFDEYIDQLDEDMIAKKKNQSR